MRSLFLVVSMVVACSSAEPIPIDRRDTGTWADQDTGPSCTALSGTYEGRRVRNATTPGSCPPDYAFTPNFPVRITQDTSAPVGYRLDLGYTDRGTGAIVFVTCGAVNVAGCTIFATCKPEAGTDEVLLKIDGNSVSGNIDRTDTAGMCTIFFTVNGTRN